jgi:hypothetical protein
VAFDLEGSDEEPAMNTRIGGYSKGRDQQEVLQLELGRQA